MLIPKGKALFQNEEGKVFRQRKWRTHAYLVDGSLDLENFQEDGIPSISEIPYYEVDGTDPSGSGGVRHYSTNHPVIREITRNLRTSHRALCLVIRAEPAPKNSEADALLAKIVAKYRHTSQAEKLTKDPPVQGPHVMADIQLVLGARPRIQRPYHLVGEREAAIHELVEEFIPRGWLEPLTANCLSPGFVVL